jgi:hypothetical protein
VEQLNYNKIVSVETNNVFDIRIIRFMTSNKKAFHKNENKVSSGAEDLSALMQALGKPKMASTPEESQHTPKRIQDHPDWAAFKEQPFPARIHFYYPNPQGKEFYWDNVRVIKLDLTRCQLIGEGHHGDPIRFDIAKMTTPRHAQTGANLQGLFGDLVRMWQEVQQEEEKQEEL